MNYVSGGNSSSRTPFSVHSLHNPFVSPITNPPLSLLPHCKSGKAQPGIFQCGKGLKGFHCAGYIICRKGENIWCLTKYHCCNFPFRARFLTFSDTLKPPFLCISLNFPPSMGVIFHFIHIYSLV